MSSRARNDVPLRSQAALAKALGVNTRTIETWIANGCPGRKPDGTYDPQRIAAWRRKRAEKRAALSAGPALERARTMLAWVKAERSALQLRRMLARFVERSEMERLFRASIAAARQVLEPLPRVLAARLVGLQPREIEAAIDDEVRAALTKLSQEPAQRRRQQRGGDR